MFFYWQTAAADNIVSQELESKIAEDIQQKHARFIEENTYSSSRHKLVQIDVEQILSLKEGESFELSTFDQDVTLRLRLNKIIKYDNGALLWRGEIINTHTPPEIDSDNTLLKRFGDDEAAIEKLKTSFSTVNLNILNWDLNVKTGAITSPAKRPAVVSFEDNIDISLINDLKFDAIKSISANITLRTSEGGTTHYVIRPILDNPKYHVFSELDPNKMIMLGMEGNSAAAEEHKRRAEAYKTFRKELEEKYPAKMSEGMPNEK